MHAADQLRLFFVAISYPWWRLDGWASRWYAGVPNHVDIAVGGRAYIVDPVRCLQAPLRHYLDAQMPARYRRVATVTPPIHDPHRAHAAAETYAVGPMTRRGTLRRVFMGRHDMMDVDCVTAAVVVLNAAGYAAPPTKTPRELLQWLTDRCPHTIASAN